MKRIYLFLVSMLLSCIAFSTYAETVTFTAGTDKFPQNSEVLTKDGVTLTAKGCINKYNDALTRDEYRFYDGSTLDIKAENMLITKIVFNCQKGYGPDKASTEVGRYTYENLTGTWVGESKDVLFNIKKKMRVRSIEVTLKSAVHVDAPSFITAEGSFNNVVEVKLGVPEGTTVRYTLDGTKPTVTSTEYTAPIKIVQTTTIKAVAFDKDENSSEVVEATYTIDVPKPSFSLAEGVYAEAQEVSINVPAGATVYYTLNGTEPTVESTKYDGEALNIAETTTLKAIAVHEGGLLSEVVEATYNLPEVVTVKDIRDDKKNGKYWNKYVVLKDVHFVLVNGKYRNIENNDDLRLETTGKDKDILDKVDVSKENPKHYDVVCIFNNVRKGNTNQVTVKKVTEVVDAYDVTLHEAEGKYWSTLCLPYSVELPEGLKAYWAEVSGRQLVLNEVADQMVPANTAVVLLGEAANYTLQKTAATAEYSKNQLKGIDTQATSNDYYLGVKAGKVAFYHWDMSGEKENRAYLPASVVDNATSIAALSVVFGEATGVQSATSSTTKEVYDLQGRRVEKMQKGHLYVVNGKKVLF